MKLSRGPLGLVAAAVLLAGCGEGGDEVVVEKRPERSSQKPDRSPESRVLAITVDGHYNPNNVGIVMAYKRGYFADAGLQVEVSNPIYPRRPATYLAQGVVDLAVTHAPQVVLMKEKGAPIIAVSSLIPRPTAAMIWLKGSKIDGIADLRGKTVGFPGLPFQKALLERVLVRAGLNLSDVKIEGVGYHLVSALANGRVDAIFGGSWNVEGVELESLGLDPVIVRVQSLDVPGYEEVVLAAREDRLAEDPKSIRKFIAAMARGTAAAIEDPEAAANAILEGTEEVSRSAAEAEVEATLPLFSRSGHMDPELASRLAGWMHEEGLIKRPVPASALLTNRYLGSNP
jgi:ABC-type nitrate/sulfonate/bicarbonate transport system substrate-binding protein